MSALLVEIESAVPQLTTLSVFGMYKMDTGRLSFDPLKQSDQGSYYLLL